MGWKGTIRSINAAAKKAEKYQRQVEKENRIRDAHTAVDKFNNYLDDVVSFHKFCFSEKVSWEKLRDLSAPLEPKNEHDNERLARYKFENYTPNFFIKLLQLENWRKKTLESKIQYAIETDLLKYAEEVDLYDTNYAEWESNRKMAEMVLDKNLLGYESAIKKYDAFYNSGKFAKNISLSNQSGTLDIEVEILDIEDVIPRQTAKVLKNGAISEKEMPVSKYHSMYQDFVCSAILRISRECFTLFPIDECIINAKVLMLDRSSGHMQDQIILSLKIPRLTIDRLRFQDIDPSQCLKNFIHNMNFKPQAGFLPVEKVESDKKTA